jgi:hypothetical protein
MIRIWLTKPIYETLPVFYLIAGAGLLIASLYLDFWYWPTICLIGGITCLILGLFIMLKRRDFRTEKRSDH